MNKKLLLLVGLALAVNGMMGQNWQLVWSEAPPVKPGVRISKKRAAAPVQAMQFTLDEIRDARLAPIVNFKGRAAGKAADAQD